MANNKKETERAELHRTIWKIACELVHAGGISAWDLPVSPPENGR